MMRAPHDTLRGTLHVVNETDLGEDLWLKHFQRFQRDSAPLMTEIRKHFAGVSSLSQLRASGIDYSSIIPTLTTWLDRTDNFRLKLAIAQLISSPAYGASKPIAKAAREIAATKGSPDSEEFRERNFVLPLISHLLVISAGKTERDLLFEFAADESLPRFTRELFIEALVKQKDKRTVPILESMLREARSAGYQDPVIVRLLKLLAKVDRERSIFFVQHFLRDPSKEVRSAAEKLEQRLTKKT